MTVHSALASGDFRLFFKKLRADCIFSVDKLPAVSYYEDARRKGKEMELIKVWRKAGFTLRIYNTGRCDRRGQSVLAYDLKDGRKVIFSDADFARSPMDADDSLETVSALLGFLTLKPGDTDREYFDKYSDAQMDWCQSARCEELAMIQYEMEELSNRRRA